MVRLIVGELSQHPSDNSLPRLPLSSFHFNPFYLLPTDSGTSFSNMGEEDEHTYFFSKVGWIWTRISKDLH